MAKRNKQPPVIDHEPSPEKVQQLFTVEVVYKSGRTSTFDNVLATVTDHQATPDNKAQPTVAYYDYMLVEQADRNSTYINMESVEELTIGVQSNG